MELNPALSVQEPLSSSSFSVYPNPVTNYFIVDADVPVFGKVNVTISDMAGRIISRIDDPQFPLEIDARHFNKGIYCVKLTGDDTAQDLIVIQ
jgi:hypothetical protein